MQNKKLTSVLSLIVCIVLIAAMALCMTACSDDKNNPPTPDSPKEATVYGEGATAFNFSVIDKDGKRTDFIINTDKTVVGDALLEHGLIAGEQGPYGLYVKTVNGTTLDFEQDGKYWAFYIDGKYAMSGVETTEITAGTNYSFKAE